MENPLHRLVSIAYLSILLCLVSLAQTVIAANITVDAECSLADAIQAAESDSEIGDCPAGDGADTIHLSGDITLTAVLPQISSDITIEGGGFTISGGDSFRIFTVADGSLAINELTLINGNAEDGGAIKNEGTLMISDSSFSDNAGESFGGAIFNDGMLKIAASIFENNRAGLDGGAIANISALNINSSSFTRNSADQFVGAGGAIVNYGELNIVGGSFTNNSAGVAGGAISSKRELNISDSSFTVNSVDGEGGAIGNFAGQLSIADSSFSGNSADDGGGAIKNSSRKDLPSAQLSITGSAFTDNKTRTSGGAISNSDYGVMGVSNSSFTDNSARFSGGAVVNYGELSVANSTFSDNSSEGRGGALQIVSDGRSTLSHLTVVKNSAYEGGGLHVKYTETAVYLRNSIFAGNESGDCVAKKLSANLGNFIADGTCDPALSGDPLLGSLVESEDGSPSYLPLLPGSPAIDAADPDYCTATDQIGTARPQGEACDIGAYEFMGE